MFQPANGLVCELDHLSGLVLSILEQREATADSVATQVALALASDTAADLARSVCDAIDGLLRAGLLEARPGVRLPCA